MVSPIFIVTRQSSHNISTEQDPTGIPGQEDGTSSSGETVPDGRAIILQAFLSRNTPQQAAEILLASLSSSTVKQYSGCLRDWWSFCQRGRHDVYNASSNEVVEFLTRKFEAGASYGSINSTKSAISFISGGRLSNDTTVNRFLKGVFRLRPQNPKYAITWDPEIILTPIENAPDPSKLQEVTNKTIILLALATAHRVQTLSLIKVENIKQSGSGLEIKIPDLIKTSKPGALQPNLILPYFRETPKICVASAVLKYIGITQGIRANCEQLFISTRRPFGPVCAQTISRWIKQILERSGIDTSVFTAHSTRHAAVFKAYRKGIDLRVIEDTAGWSEKSTTFARSYNRPIEESRNSFASAILGNSL